MAVKDLVSGINTGVPENVKTIAKGLLYRDFITVVLLVNKLAIQGRDGQMIKDNWICVQEKEAKLGRIQIFNNWSPYMVKEPFKVWMGLEYFCIKDDEIWSMTDKEIVEFTINELELIGIVKKGRN